MTTETQVADTPPAAVEERLAELERAVADLGRQVAELADEAVYPAELSVLPGLELRRPIPIVVEESADDVGRALDRARNHGTRPNSEGEAIESLRRSHRLEDLWPRSCAQRERRPALPQHAGGCSQSSRPMSRRLPATGASPYRSLLKTTRLSPEEFDDLVRCPMTGPQFAERARALFEVG